MITLKELNAYLHDYLHCGLFVDYCKNGIQVEGAKSVARIATAVSANLDTLEAAQKLSVDALIVHHGLFWKNDSHVISGSKREKVKILLLNDMSLLAYHLPLDAHLAVGNNWKAAKDMGWTDLQPFGMFDGQMIGVKGRFNKISRDVFKRQLEEFYGHSSHCALGGNEEVESAALISGGAYRSVLEAAAQGIDCFVTGNFDEPAWNFAFEERINFFAMGHSATEKIGVKALGEHLAEKFGLWHTFLDIHNPF
jgi:dinuclear metal center YbgI/SA1388 family protein